MAFPHEKSMTDENSLNDISNIRTHVNDVHHIYSGVITVYSRETEYHTMTHVNNSKSILFYALVYNGTTQPRRYGLYGSMSATSSATRILGLHVSY